MPHSGRGASGFYFVSANPRYPEDSAMPMRIHHPAVTLAFSLLVAAAGCSSSSTPSVDAAGTGGTGGGGGTDGPATDGLVLPAGPVAGPADDHCAGGKVQEVDPAVCHAGPPDAGADDGGA